MFFYKVPGPNEALLITGAGAKVDTKKVALEERAQLGDAAPRVEETQDFKVVTGHGAFVLPVFQRSYLLSLDTRRVDLGDEGHGGGVQCVSRQSIPVIVEAVMIYKIGDDQPSIRNAGRRFQDKTPEDIDLTVKEMAHGHLRTIIAGLTVEQLITDRQALTEAVRDATAADMQKLGLHIDTMQVKEIRDVDVSRDGSPGYIENLGKPQAAAVAAQARIAAANADREASVKEQEAQALVAEANRDAAVRKAKAQAETDQAQARQAQAGPLAAAVARQDVVEADTRAASLEASLAEQRLQTEVRKPADAKAYAVAKEAEGAKEASIAHAQADAERTRLSAVAAAQARKVQSEAEAGAIEMTGRADATAIEAKALAEASGKRQNGLAEAAGIEARQKALASNPEGVVAQQIAEALPAIVAAAAKQYDNVGQLTVLNGIEGLNEGLLSTVGVAAAIMPLAKQLMEAVTRVAATAEPR